MNLKKLEKIIAWQRGFSNGMRPDWKGGGAVATGNGAGRDPRNPAKPFYNRCLFWKETFVQEAAAVQNKRL